MNISPLAVVHPEAQIGQNVTIDPFAVIEKDVVIGDNCHIYSHAVILDGARIGKNCNIFPGAVVAGIPQDMKFAGETTTAEIGDNTTLRECVTINRGTASKGKTVVGRNCLIMAYSHVAHDCVLKDHIIIGNASQIAGEVGGDVPPSAEAAPRCGRGAHLPLVAGGVHARARNGGARARAARSWLWDISALQCVLGAEPVL